MYATANLNEGTKGNLPIVRGKKNNLSVSGAGSANGESTFNRFPSRMTGSFNPNVNSPLFNSQYGTHKQSMPTSTKNTKKQNKLKLPSLGSLAGQPAGKSFI